MGILYILIRARCLFLSNTGSAIKDDSSALLKLVSRHSAI